MKKRIQFIAVLAVLGIILMSGCLEEPQPVEKFCVKSETGEKLSLSEAKEIARASECGDQLKDAYFCNEITGTWWIDLDMEKEGCNPACVVNVVTKTAEINWRCTGVILPPEEKAVEVARNFVRMLRQFKDGNGRSIEILNVTEGNCSGCWVVDLQLYLDARVNPEDTNKANVKLTIEDWKIVEGDFIQRPGKVLTPQECEEKDGRNVNTVAGNGCDEGETNIAEVKGFISPNICCLNIDSFEDCANAGFPVMESYPRQCKANGELFVEEIEGILALEEALEIAEGSECTEKGTLTRNYLYNNDTKTWWIGLEMKEEFEKEDCNPVCVVSEETGKAEINWRCTGAIIPTSEETHCEEQGGMVVSGPSEEGVMEYCLFEDSESYCGLEDFFNEKCQKEEDKYICDAIGSRSEGYYDADSGELIGWADCG